jgi:hypothetical protein
MKKRISLRGPNLLDGSVLPRDLNFPVARVFDQALDCFRQSRDIAWRNQEAGFLVFYDGSYCSYGVVTTANPPAIPSITYTAVLTRSQGLFGGCVALLSITDDVVPPPRLHA